MREFQFLRYKREYFNVRFNLLLLLLGLLLSCAGNNDEDNYAVVSKPMFTYYGFKKAINRQLPKDVSFNYLNDSTLYANCDMLESSDSLIPSFEGNFSHVVVNGTSQYSGTSMLNFNNLIKYELYDLYGNKSEYSVIFKTLHDIPIINIITGNREPIISKAEYLNAEIRIQNCPEYGEIISEGKVRGRGNATWYNDKKPYKIKFSTKQRPFNFSSNKEWVLLAESHDKTLLRTLFVNELSRILKMDYTVNCKMVDLFVNNTYLGVYTFTDQVEKGIERVNIDKDGFFIERDNWYMDEPLFFTTDSLNNNFTFKYPDADDGDIRYGDDNYQFIVHFMNSLESSLLKLKDDPTNIDYQDYLDINSFAKYAILIGVTCTFDSNLFYVLANRNSKMKMYPIWDVEMSLGEWSYSWGDRPDPLEQYNLLLGSKMYFRYLLNSPVFRKELKSEWNEYKVSLSQAESKLDSVSNSINKAWDANFALWGGQFSREEELNTVKKFYRDRLHWFDSYIESL